MPTLWVACDLSHVCSLWILWQGMQLSHAFVFHMPKPALLYTSTFDSLFLPFFVLVIFKFKYGKFFVRHSATISKFKWFEQARIKFHYSYISCQDNITTPGNESHQILAGSWTWLRLHKYYRASYWANISQHAWLFK